MGTDTETGYFTDIDELDRYMQDTRASDTEGPTCAGPEYRAGLLESFGPVWIVEIGNPNHAVMVVGVNGDGTPEGTTITLNNPWPPNQGAIEIKSFSDFEHDFEWAPSPNAQIVHR